MRNIILITIVVTSLIAVLYAASSQYYRGHLLIGHNALMNDVSRSASRDSINAIKAFEEKYFFQDENGNHDIKPLYQYLLEEFLFFEPNDSKL